LVQKFSSVKLYTSIALLIILYGSEIWKKGFKKKQMKFFRRIVGYAVFTTKGIKKFWKR